MNDPGPPPAGRTMAQLLLLGLSVSVPGCIGVTVAGAAQEARVPLPATGTAAVLVSLVLVARSRRLGARGMGLAGAAAALLGAAPLAWLSYIALGRSIEQPWFLTAYQWDEPGVRFDVWLGVMAALGGLGLVGAFAGFLPSLMGARVPRLHTVARAVVTAGGVVLAAALARGLRFPSADGPGLLDAVPIVGVLPPVAGHADDGAVRAGDVEVTRTCALEEGRPVFRCAFRFQRGGTSFDLSPSRRAFAYFRGEGGVPALAPVDLPMTVRHDPRSDLWLVETGGWALAAGAATGRASPVRVRDVAHVLAPPLGWRGAAAFTLGLALLALLRARLAERRHRAAAVGGDRDDGETEADAHAAAAIAIAVLGTTPLLVAALVGMAP